MQLIQRGIVGRIPHIKHKSKCDVQIKGGKNGEFTIAASWPGGSYNILFSRRRGLGTTASKVPLQQRMAKTICGFTEDIIRELRRARGL